MKMAGIGVNLRVTGHCNQGGRMYMEDMFSVAYQQTADMKDLEYAFFGIFDGHGGAEAATFAKEHLLDCIVNQKQFWSNNDDDILRAIKEGFLITHHAMWRDYGSWPIYGNGLPSTSGTTATVAFIMKGKVYYGHVGDTAIVLGYQVKGEQKWRAKLLTKDHKPDLLEERSRIRKAGGKVVMKSGIPRVVWNRPRLGHVGPVRRSTCIDQVPFLAVARSLGDFWSYNSERGEFIVSPEPDVGVYTIDVTQHRCLLFGTDGLWNMLDPDKAISLIQNTEIHNEKQVIYNSTYTSSYNQQWMNPSKDLVDRALDLWLEAKQRADNTSVVTLMLDPPGPPRAQVLLNQRQKVQPPQVLLERKDDFPNSGGVAIFTRFPGGLTTQHSPTHMESTPNSAITIGSKKTIIRRPKSTADDATSTSLRAINAAIPNTNMYFKDDVGAEPCCSYSEALMNKTAMPSHPSLKRRTRSEDKGAFLPDGGSDVENERLGWPSDNRESDGKKRKVRSDLQCTKAKNWRASAPGKVHHEPSHTLEVRPRMLRSDTLAALPIKTLRSRNVDLRGSFQKKPFDNGSSHVNSINNERPAINVRIKKSTPAKCDQPSTPSAQQWTPQAMMTRSHGKI